MSYTQEQKEQLISKGRELRAGGMSYTRIAKQLGIASATYHDWRHRKGASFNRPTITIHGDEKKRKYTKRKPTPSNAVELSTNTKCLVVVTEISNLKSVLESLT